jgi:deoxyribodipyrimidine photolyase
METTDNQPITRKDYNELVEIIQQSFHGAQEHTQEQLNSFREEVHGEFQHFREEIRQEIKGEVSAAEGRLQDSNAVIAKEISDMRAEQAAILGGRMRVNDTLLTHGGQLREHEVRIGKLEAGE